MAIKFSTTLLNNRLDEITSLRDAGAGPAKIRIYSGARPAFGGGETTVLAELAFADPSSAAAAAGVLTANAIVDTNAVATGTATWFRELDSDNNILIDGDVGTGGSDLNLNTTSIVIGNPVAITSYTITEVN